MIECTETEHHYSHSSKTVRRCRRAVRVQSTRSVVLAETLSRACIATRKITHGRQEMSPRGSTRPTKISKLLSPALTVVAHISSNLCGSSPTRICALNKTISSQASSYSLTSLGNKPMHPSWKKRSTCRLSEKRLNGRHSLIFLMPKRQCLPS